jgi:WD40 repeat protein
MEHDIEVRALTGSEDGNTAVSGSEDGMTCLWDLRSKHLVRCWEHSYEGVTGLEIGSTGKELVATYGDGNMFHVDIGTGRTLRKLVCPTRITCVRSDGVHAITGDNDGFVRLWNLQDGTEVARVAPKSASAVTCLDYNPVAQIIVAGHAANKDNVVIYATEHQV